MQTEDAANTVSLQFSVAT